MTGSVCSPRRKGEKEAGRRYTWARQAAADITVKTIQKKRRRRRCVNDCSDELASPWAAHEVGNERYGTSPTIDARQSGG